MTTSLKTTLLIVLAVVIVGIGAYALFTRTALSPTESANTTESRYVNERHGFSFERAQAKVLGYEQGHQRSSRG